MPRIYPFSALRPAPGQAARVGSPPYDVMSTEEARAMCAGNDASFLRVVRPDVELSDTVDHHGKQAYEVAARNLAELRTRGLLIQDAQPAVYVYRLGWQGRSQTGLVSLASVEDYDQGIIRKHEHTRPDKEADRADHIEALGAQTGPVFLLCRAQPDLSEWLEKSSSHAPDFDFVAEDGVSHTGWSVADASGVAEVQAIFSAMDATYVADGHHRSAAASVVNARRKAKGLAPDPSFGRFLTVTFPDDQVRILPYNRALLDLNGLDRDSLLQKLEQDFEIRPLSGPAGPQESGVFDLFLADGWRRLRARASWIPDDPVAGLDVAVLQHAVLAPLFGIDDPRTNQRIAFVGGIRGTGELEAKVRSGDFSAAFALCATPVSALLAVADVGRVMPPKSTWFEPKLRSGLFVHQLGDT